MATQIPHLERMNAPDEASVGRIDAKLPDALPGMEMQAKASERLGAHVVQYAQKVQDDAIDTETTDLTTRYEGQYRQELEEAKNYEGNPTERYAKVDENMNKAFEEMMASGERLPGLGREVLARKLRDKATQFEMHKLQQASAHQDKYDESVVSAALENEASGLVMTTELIHAGEPSTLKPFDMGVRRIQDLVLQHASKRGGVEQAENGTHVMTGPDGNPVYVNLKPSAQLALKKALSDNISNALETVIDAGQLEAAEVIKEKYWGSIDSEAQKKLAKNFEKVSIDQAAALLSRHPNEKKKILAGFPEAVRIKIEDEAAQKVHDKVIKAEAMRKIRDDQFGRAAFAAGKPLVDSGVPVTLTDLKESPAWDLIQKIEDPKKRQNNINYFVVPKEDNEKARQAMDDLFFGRNEEYDIASIPEDKYNEMKAGLGKSSRNFYDRQRFMALSETGTEETTKVKSMAEELEKSLFNMGYIKRTLYGHYEGKNLKKLNEANELLKDYVAANPGPMNPQQRKDFAKAAAISIAKKQQFKAPEFTRFNGGGKKFAKNETKDQQSEDPKVVRKRYLLQFIKEHDGRAPIGDQLDKYIEKLTKGE